MTYKSRNLKGGKKNRTLKGGKKSRYFKLIKTNNDNLIILHGRRKYTSKFLNLDPRTNKIVYKLYKNNKFDIVKYAQLQDQFLKTLLLWICKYSVNKDPSTCDLFANKLQRINEKLEKQVKYPVHLQNKSIIDNVRQCHIFHFNSCNSKTIIKN